MSEKAWLVHAAKHLTEQSVSMSVTRLVKKRKAREHLEERRESKRIPASSSGSNGSHQGSGNALNSADFCCRVLPWGHPFTMLHLMNLSPRTPGGSLS